jgi:NAD(P)H-flavin reductase
VTEAAGYFDPAPFRVERVVRETADVCTLTLRGERPFAFEPGQFNMLYAWGAGEAAISISGDPGAPETLEHTIRAVGNVTSSLCRANEGDTILVRGPFGTPWPVEAARGRDVLIVAGGIGLAPLRSVVLRLRQRAAEFGRVTVVYGARSPHDLLFASELREWKRHARVDLIVDRADEHWRGETGVVTRPLARVELDAGNAVALLCGPEIMMRFSARELARRGMTEDRIYVSLERNMKCGIGVCGHCQLGPYLICRDGPVQRFDQVARFLYVPEL